MPKVMTIATTPPITTRMEARVLFAPPASALSMPVMRRATTEAAKTACMRKFTGDASTEKRGMTAPQKNDDAEAKAAYQGLELLSTDITFSVSLWALTDTYSPAAMDNAPATKPAVAAVKIKMAEFDAPDTPTMIDATEMMPSLAPSTAARIQFSLDLEENLID